MSHPRKRATRPLRGNRAKAAGDLFLQGWSPRDVARVLRTSTSRIYQVLRRWPHVLVVLALAWPAPAAAQGIVIPNTFVAGTAADPDEVNDNFAALANNALNRAGGTMTGTLTTQVVVPDGDNTRNLGSAGASWANAWIDGTLTVATVAATTLTGNGAVVAGQLAHFNLAACPSGWTDKTATLAGFYLVAKYGGQSSGTTVGTALTSGENRAVGQHNHGVTDPGHVHPVERRGFQFSGTDGAAGPEPTFGNTANTASATTGISINNAGGVAGTNAPYAVFILCEKS